MTTEYDAAAGAAARDEGMDRAAKSAGMEWIAKALDAVALIASRKALFTTDDLWPYIAPPPEPRAMGAVMARAAKLGWAEVTNQVERSNRKTCHRRPLAVWRSLRFVTGS